VSEVVATVRHLKVISLAADDYSHLGVGETPIASVAQFKQQHHEALSKWISQNSLMISASRTPNIVFQADVRGGMVPVLSITIYLCDLNI